MARSDTLHEREYESAKETAGRTDLPKWSDLTEDQRQNIREENSRYWRELHEFGQSLRKEQPHVD